MKRGLAAVPASDPTPRVAATEEERDLVRRMRAGDERAFEMFADHYVPALHRFAASRLRGEPDLTRDVVQSTICRAIERLDSWRAEAPLFTWLCACCRNEIGMHFRRTRRFAPDAEIDDEPVDGAPGPEDVVLASESVSLVHQALDHLPPRYATALEWKYLEGTAVEEIARRLGVSGKAAESLLTRARNAFHEVYRKLVEVKP